MLQRIQSLFLLLAGALSLLTWATPVRTYTSGTSELLMLTRGIQQSDGTPMADVSMPVPFHVIHTVIGLAFLVSIFLYRNRIRQARIIRGTWLVALLNGVLQFISSRSLDAYLRDSGEVVGHYGISFYIPIAVVVFAILAERAIKKDDELVRSADRLR
ncbi:MAG: DUF4293 family protein [Flavobacteriales bacterium]|nr:DUF4293 family protein [Flavobacteriales bacterium]